MRDHIPATGTEIIPMVGAILLVALLLAACSSPADTGLEGGVLATFDVNGERYSIFITNGRTIDQVFALRDGLSNARIPKGRVFKGRVSYNSSWSWHIDPESVTMVESTAELCDGEPSYVEDHLDEWIAKVGDFCPWAARLVVLKDYR